MDEELKKLTLIVLLQGEVPWNPRAEEHSSSINDDFHKYVIAASEADAQTRAEKDQVLMNLQQEANNPEVKAARIFNCLMEVDEKSRQEAIPNSDVSPDVPRTNNTYVDQD